MRHPIHTRGSLPRWSRFGVAGVLIAAGLGAAVSPIGNQMAATLGYGTATAQEPGDAVRGLTYAKSVCAECHGVEPKGDHSPNSSAPTFKAVANTPGMTGAALVVWMQSPHPSMPQLVVPVDDRNDLIAYILSLKDNPGGTRG